MTGTSFSGSRPFGWLLAFVLLASAIFIEALHAPTIDDSVIPHLDKMLHAAVFGLLAFLLLRLAFSFGFSNSWRTLLGVSLIVIALGVLDEWVQASVPGRTASLMDVLADVVGVLAYMLFKAIDGNV